MEVKVDVAVIGAGPAGSTLAAVLAGRGVATALIDRDRMPRDKICGEFLSYDALPILEALGLISELDRIGAPSIRRCRVQGRARSIEFAFPEPARGISRLRFDEMLFRAAVRRGAADWSGWTAAAIDPEQGEVRLDRVGESAVVRARLLVGAWGRWGRFDTQLQRPFVRDRSRRNFGFKRHYRSLNPPSDSVDLYSFDRGYLGVSAVEDGLTNICGLTHAERLSGHRGGWQSFVAALRAEEPRLDSLYRAHAPQQESFLSSDPVIFRARSPVERGLFLAGDAAGVIDPLTGNGMAMAVQSAVLAAPFVREALAGRDDAARKYRHAHHSLFARRIRWSRRVARLLSHPALLNSALAFPRGAAVGQFLLARTRAERAALDTLTRTLF